MRDPVFPAFCALGALLCALPLPWHWQARNSGTLLFLGWTITGSVVFLVNSLVWAGNTNDVAPVWCDISSKIVIGQSVGIPASSLCIQRRLYRIATIERVTSFRDSWKQDMVIDLLIGIGLPALNMALFYVVQINRYNIIEDIGCWPTSSASVVSIPLTRLWPILIGCASFIYAGLTIRAFLKTRRQFSNILSDSGSNLSMSRYFRLMALAGTDMAFTVPLALYFLINNLIVYPPTPWISWEDVHDNIHEVWTYSRAEILSSPSLAISFDINRWALPGCAFIFFAYFGFSREATDYYKKIFWRIVAPLGFKPPAPQPQRQTTSWPRRIATRFTMSGRDDVTISPAVHATLDATHSTADPAADPDVKSSFSPIQSPTEEKIKDLESQT